MAAKEGFRRLRLLGNSVLALGLLLLAGALISWLVAVALRTGAPFVAAFGPFGILLSALGAAILLIAWIAEGFCEPRQPPGS
ncbi:MAG TPA: hypothetical protein VHZ09_01715 [Acidobacteriaceae bacterium]|jgi:hypothetical protein|nr:hypothetical protein [Acidobacteriaceae bacterium]